MIPVTIIANRDELELRNAVFSRVLRDSTPRFVSPSVPRSVGQSVTLLFLFYDLYSLTSLFRPKWSSDLKYGPCPPARDWGSRVFGLVYIKDVIK